MDKLNEEDEGQLQIGIGVKDNAVIVNFFKPVAWIGLDKETALKVANALITEANKIQVH